MSNLLKQNQNLLINRIEEFFLCQNYISSKLLIRLILICSLNSYAAGIFDMPRKEFIIDLSIEIQSCYHQTIIFIKIMIFFMGAHLHFATIPMD